MAALASTIEGETNSGLSSTALLISANSKTGYVNITMPTLRVICHPFGKTWYNLLIYKIWQL